MAAWSIPGQFFLFILFIPFISLILFICTVQVRASWHHLVARQVPDDGGRLRCRILHHSHLGAGAPGLDDPADAAGPQLLLQHPSMSSDEKPQDNWRSLVRLCSTRQTQFVLAYIHGMSSGVAVPSPLNHCAVAVLTGWRRAPSLQLQMPPTLSILTISCFKRPPVPSPSAANETSIRFNCEFQHTSIPLNSHAGGSGDHPAAAGACARQPGHPQPGGRRFRLRPRGRHAEHLVRRAAARRRRLCRESLKGDESGPRHGSGVELAGSTVPCLFDWQIERLSRYTRQTER